jgi:hypothetical protein
MKCQNYNNENLFTRNEKMSSYEEVCCQVFVDLKRNGNHQLNL